MCCYCKSILKGELLVFKFIPAYITTVIVMLILDIIWLGVVAKPMYQHGLGHLMAIEPNLVFAALFYLVFVFGLMWFSVVPNFAKIGVKQTFLAALIFGFFVYASYDLTNLALLKDWPLGLSLIDISWGTLLSGVSASAGKVVFDRFNRG